MAIVSKSQSESSQNIINNYEAVVGGNGPDTSAGTVNLDIIDPVAQQVSDAYTSIENTRLLTSWQDAGSDAVTIDGMSPIGLNLDVYALGATKATGTVYFQKATQPTVIVDFPIGTVVRTQPDTDVSTIKFVTTTAARLSPDTTLNPENRRYEVSATVEAVVAGSDGNVGPGSIDTLDTPNRNIDTLTNKEATTGGSDAEDTEAYAARLRAATSSIGLGTEAGYATTLQSLFSDIEQIKIAGPGDSALVREEFGNEADIYLVGASYSTFTNVLYVSGADFEYLTTHPATVVSSVVGTTTGINYVLGTDVRFDQDTSAVYGGSTKAFDKITWLSGTRPGTGQNISVTGQYSLLVNNVQDYLDRDDARFVTSDILAKEATRVGIVITATASALSGYDRTTLESNIQSALIDGLTEYNMGTDVNQSDIVSMIGNVEGVDKVGIPLTELRKTTEDSGTLDDPVSITTAQYARYQSSTITVS